MRFKLRAHSDPIGNREGVKIVEVYDDENRFIAMVAPGRNDQEIRVITKHFVRAHEDHRGMPFIPGVIASMQNLSAVNIWLHRSTDTPKPLDAEDKAFEEALAELHRQMAADPKRKRATLVKRTSFEVLPEATPLEEITRLPELEIIAIAITEEALEALVECDACGQAFAEERWVGAEDRCPSCGKVRRTES